MSQLFLIKLGGKNAQFPFFEQAVEISGILFEGILFLMVLFSRLHAPLKVTSSFLNLAAFQKSDEDDNELCQRWKYFPPERCQSLKTMLWNKVNLSTLDSNSCIISTGWSQQKINFTVITCWNACFCSANTHQVFAVSPPDTAASSYRI